MPSQSDSYLELVTDVLVIGSGGAALRAALSADFLGAKVLIAVKGNYAMSGATYYSVAEIGAFNVPDGAADPADSPARFLEDILSAGSGMCDGRLSRILSEEASEAMQFLEHCGVDFAKKDAKYLAFQACFSSRPRSHVIYNHFKPVLKALAEQVSRREIMIVEQIMVTNLIVRNGCCYGAYAIDKQGNSIVIRSKATILATGGASQLFRKNLYPLDITGDGYAMAYRAGAHLTNMEFMQAGIGVVYPFINLFGNYLWNAVPSITNKYGQVFLPKYLPSDTTVGMVMREKAGHFPFSSRDISRFIELSVHKEISSGNATENGGAYLDFHNTDFRMLLADKASNFSKMWPLTYEWYRKRNIDLYTDKIEIACFAHAINGGVRIGQNSESSVNGLFAAGEVAGGPHGADRLGGNMAVTCQVFGKRAGEAAARYSSSMNSHRLILDIFKEEKEFQNQFTGKGSLPISTLRKRLQKCADERLLIARSRGGLEAFLSTLNSIEESLLSNSSISDVTERICAVELMNLIVSGRLMAKAALLRTESRGSHYREDYPLTSKEWNTSIILDRNSVDGYFTGRLEDIPAPSRQVLA
jgi:L-aspartate oxidase